jgi:hypothetical protein
MGLKEFATIKMVYFRPYSQYSTIPLFHLRGKRSNFNKCPIFSLSCKNSETFNYGSVHSKKISITNEQKQFLENYKKWGFSDQSSIIREALSLFINELATRERKTLMAQKHKISLLIT